MAVTGRPYIPRKGHVPASQRTRFLPSCTRGAGTYHPGSGKSGQEPGQRKDHHLGSMMGRMKVTLARREGICILVSGFLETVPQALLPQSSCGGRSSPSQGSLSGAAQGHWGPTFQLPQASGWPRTGAQLCRCGLGHRVIKACLQEVRLQGSRVSGTTPCSRLLAGKPTLTPAPACVPRNDQGPFKGTISCITPLLATSQWLTGSPSV